SPSLRLPHRRSPSSFLRMEEFDRVKRRKNLFLFGFVLFVALCAFVYFFSRSSRRVREIASGSGTASRFWSAGADAGYVDPSLCRACHSDIYKTYKLTGMGRSFSRPTAENTAQNSR